MSISAVPNDVSSITITGTAHDQDGISAVEIYSLEAGSPTATGTTAWHAALTLKVGYNHIQITATTPNAATATTAIDIVRAAP
jgi:hypothetical protein